MNTKDIEKREELCRLLNMDFDEAGELFSDETMQSMQMAQVNGGVLPWWQKLLPYIAAGATEVGISELYQDAKNWLFGKPTSAGGVIKFKDANGKDFQILIEPNSNIKVKELSDSTGLYYREITISPK